MLRILVKNTPPPNNHNPYNPKNSETKDLHNPKYLKNINFILYNFR